MPQVVLVSSLGPQGPTGPQGPIGPTGSFDSVTGSFTTTASFNAFTSSYNTASFSGSFIGSGAGLFNIPASGITGLNLSQIASGSVSASISLGTGSFVVSSGSTNFLFINNSGNIGVNTSTPFSDIPNVGSGSIDLGNSRSNVTVGGFAVLGKTSINGYGAVGSNYYLDNANALRRRNGDSVSILGFDAGGFSFTTAGNGAVGSSISGTYSAVLNSSGNFTIGNGYTTLGARIGIKGSGATSSTTSLLVQNSAAATMLQLRDDNFTLFGPNGLGIDNFNCIIYRTSYNNQSISFHGSRLSFADATGFVFSNNYISTPATSAIFDIQSTSKGFLPPRTNLTSNISAPAQGLQTYLTGSTNEGLYYYNSGSYQGWTRVLNNSGSQSISGSLNLTGALTASSAIISGDVIIQGTASVNTLIVNQTQLSTGSNQLGDAANDTQTLYGSVIIPTGSLTVTGSLTIKGATTSSLSSSLLIQNSGSTRTLSYTEDGTLTLSNGIYTTKWYMGSSYIPTLEFSSGGTILWGTGNSLNFLGNGVDYRIGYNNSFATTNASMSFSAGHKGFFNFVTVGTTTTYNAIGSIFSDNSNSGLILNYKSAGVDTEGIRLTNTGLVGIGTTSPTAKLQVKGSGATSSTTSFLVQNANASSSLTVLDDGNVGIGTASPIYKLQVIGSAGNIVHILADTGQSAIIGATGAGTNRMYIGYSPGTENIAITSGNVLRLNPGGSGNVLIGTTTDAGYKTYISGTGTLGSFNVDDILHVSGSRVGIGTTSPSASLHISGASNSVLFEIDSPAVNNILYVSGSGNVGINTSSPTTPLFVKGRGNSSSTTAFLVENSTSGSSFSVRDDGVVRILGSNTDAQITLTPSNGTSQINLNSQSVTGTLQTSTTGTYAGLGLLTSTQGQNTNIGTSLSGAGGGIRYWASLNGSQHSHIFYYNLVEQMRLSYTGNLIVGISGSDTSRLSVRGSGTTSSTTSFLVQNANASSSLQIADDGTTTILQNTNAVSAFKIQASTRSLFFTTNAIGGTFNSFSGAENGTSGVGNFGFVIASGWGFNIGTTNVQSDALFTVNPTGVNTGGIGMGTVSPNASSILDITSTTKGFLQPRMTAAQRDAISAPVAGLQVYNSSTNRNSLHNGTIWSNLLTDSGSQSISGSVIIDNGLFDTVSTGSIPTGSTLVYSFSTASYQAGFFDYYVSSGSNFRAGTIMSVAGAGTYKFTDQATPDIGNTTNLQFSMSLATSNLQLYASASSAGWTVKTTFRTI